LHISNSRYLKIADIPGTLFDVLMYNSQDAMSVEQALLLNDRKVDGNRKLRVTTAKVFRQSARDLKLAENLRRPASKTVRVL
jgi:hypothetical protein